MSILSALWCVLAGLVFVAGGLVVADAVRRQFFASYQGSAAVTTVVLVWLCWALGLGQLLGAVGLIRRMALLAGALISAAGAVGLRRWAQAPGRADAAPDATAPEAAATTAPDATTPDTAATTAPEPEPEPAVTGSKQRALTLVTALLVVLVAALWTARTVIAAHRGINDPDSLGYHLPFIVTFANSGYADQHRLLVPLLPVQFFPANDELLSAMALALTHSLLFAAVKNLLLGGLVLVAAHALGKAFGAAKLTVAVTAIALGFPVFAFSQPGEGVNDTLLLLLLIGGLAVLAHAVPVASGAGRAPDRPAPYVLALACAGLMLGVKLSGIVPAAALAAVALIFLLARVPNHRWRWAATGLLASAALGGSWYLRNAIDYGNPIPSVHIAIGPLQLHTVRGTDAAIAYSVAHYALHGQLLNVFSHGLVRGLGPLYLLPVALVLLGAVYGAVSRNRFLLALSALGLISIVGYVFTPAGAYGPPNVVPQSFVINLHYAVPALLPGALAGAIALARWRWAWVLPALGLVAVLSSISRGRTIATWSPEIGGRGLVLLLLAGVIGAIVVAWGQPAQPGPAQPQLARPRPGHRRLASVGASAAAVVAVSGVAVIARHYPSRQSTDPVARWAATVPGARIGEWTGDIGDLYGPREQNHVTIVSQLVDGAAEPVVTCQAFKSALVDSKVDYAAVLGGTVWARWLSGDTAFRLVANDLAGATKAETFNLRRYDTEVYAIIGKPDQNCAGQLNQ